MKIYRPLVLLCCVITTLTACTSENKSSIGANSATQENTGYVEKLPDYIDQNWTHETRMEWWYTSQGSRLLPYAWFLALERPNSTDLVGSKENLKQYRFIAWPADPKWNPDGLPIGFVGDVDKTTNTKYLGFNCAACHTGKAAYQGKEYIVEGAPAHHDFDRFTTEITEALAKTFNDNAKFARFSTKVLGEAPSPKAIAVLKDKLAEQSQKLGFRLKINRPPHPNGYARLDAFGNIFNEVVVNAVNQPGNAKTVDAPVSYPMLWDTPQHDIVQWNGAAVNAGIGPYSRNVGEVVGVFGDLQIDKKDVLGFPVMSFKNHINIPNLGRLESILTTLWSPLWPASLPAIDQNKALSGKLIYEKQCVGCHHNIKRDDPNRKVEAVLTPATKIGTDPTMAANIATRTSKTGILQGQPVFPLSKLEIINKLLKIPEFEAEAQSVQMVLYGVVGIIRNSDLGPVTQLEGLKKFIDAGTKNTFKANCDPEKQGVVKCALPPRYKARPLNGIWASAPYLHNGSVPNLWELLQKPEKRAVTFNVGSWEIDPVNVGFSTAKEDATSMFDTSLTGNSNKGHLYGTKLSDKEKWELIEYLKTL